MPQFFVLQSVEHDGEYLTDDVDRIVFYPIIELAEAHLSMLARNSGAKTAARWKVAPIGAPVPTIEDRFAAGRGRKRLKTGRIETRHPAPSAQGVGGLDR